MCRGIFTTRRCTAKFRSPSISSGNRSTICRDACPPDFEGLPPDFLPIGRLGIVAFFERYCERGKFNQVRQST